MSIVGVGLLLGGVKAPAGAVVIHVEHPLTLCEKNVSH